MATQASFNRSIMLLPSTCTRLARLASTRLFATSSGESFNYCVDLADSDYTQVLFTDDLPCASLARTDLENLLGNPREPSAERFAWDPWFVSSGEGRNGKEAPLPGDGDWSWEVLPDERETASKQVQFSMTRAQANSVLSEPVYEALIDEITVLGNSIGCAAMTPPWISLYGNGQMQNFHTDPKQGSMAWTLSLSKGYGETFSGGETLMLSPNVLDYWRDFDGSRGKEAASLIRFLPPTFGRFTAFDPRVPHMVQKVEAPNVGPLQSRIMVHGWFAEPEVIWFFGDDEEEESKEMLDKCLEDIMSTFGSSDIGRVIGFLSIRVEIAASGEVTDIIAVCDTLRGDPADNTGVVGYDQEGREVLEDATSDIRLTIREALGNLKFPETKEGGAVVVPFDFV